MEDDLEALTEGAIARNLLAREGEFFPITDSIVRKTTARLRDKLTTYYASEGRAANFRILLARGTYKPAFIPKERVHAPLSPLRAPRLLLLPFNPINFYDEDFFADGLLEDLMISLAAGGGLAIVPWTTAHYLRERTGDVREYYRITEAEIILDGTVRRLGSDSYQITLLWVDGITAVFDAVLQAKVKAQDTGEAVLSLSDQISKRLGTHYSEDVMAQIGPRHTTNVEARSLYLRAQQENRKGTGDGIRKSFAYLQRALDVQPDYAAAHALKADAHIYAGIAGLGQPQREMVMAKDSARTALKIAPKLASALTAKGGVQFAFNWDFAAAKRSLRTARALDPTSDNTHFWSEAVMAAADPQGASEQMEMNAQQDNCSAATAYLASSYCYNAREWKRTEFWARRSIELDPAYVRPYPFLAGACLEQGRTEEALRYAETARKMSGPNPYTSGMMGVVLARTGRKSEARAYIDDHNPPPGQYRSSMGKSVIYAALGEKQAALDSLRQMVEDRDPYVTWLHIFPFFDSLHGDAQFEKLLKTRLGG